MKIKEALNGIHWDLGKTSFELPYLGDSSKASLIFNRNIIGIAWNFLRTLEKNPTSLPQTATILEGMSVSGIDALNLMQVKNYGDGCKLLRLMIGNGSFELAAGCACSINSLAGREDDYQRRLFGKSSALLHKTSTESLAKNLEKIAKTGFSFLSREIKDPIEKAVGAFLFMARNQFFHDANKRKASLMMNGSLIQLAPLRLRSPSSCWTSS